MPSRILTAAGLLPAPPVQATLVVDIAGTSTVMGLILTDLDERPLQLKLPIREAAVAQVETSGNLARPLRT